MTNPFQKDATRISAMTPTEDAPINCFSLGNEISYHIKKCVPGRTLAPSAVAVRQHSTFRASAHPQRSVFFYTIGNEISYRIKKLPHKTDCQYIDTFRISLRSLQASSPEIACAQMRGPVT